MTAIVYDFPSRRVDATPDRPLWTAAGMILSGFDDPEDASLVAPPCSVAALAVAMYKLSLVADETVRRIWDARPCLT